MVDSSIGKKKIALTFDSGPGLGTPRILDVLDRYQVSASFFVVGTFAMRSPDIIQRLIQSKHLIGNHTWSHCDLCDLSSKRVSFELLLCQTALSAYGICPRFMRPPYASIDHCVFSQAQSCGLIPVLYDHEIDLVFRSVESLRRGIHAHIREEGSIRFPDVEETAQILPHVLEALNPFCQFVTVDTLHCPSVMYDERDLPVFMERKKRLERYRMRFGSLQASMENAKIYGVLPK